MKKDLKEERYSEFTYMNKKNTKELLLKNRELRLKINKEKEIQS